MYENLSGKLQVLAIITMIVMTIGGIVGGIVIFAEADGEFIIVGILTIIAGFFMGWISSWPLYALGEIHEKIVSTEANVSMLGKSPEEKKKAQMEAQKMQEQLNAIDNQCKSSMGNTLG